MENNCCKYRLLRRAYEGLCSPFETSIDIYHECVVVFVCVFSCLLLLCLSLPRALFVLHYNMPTCSYEISFEYLTEHALCGKTISML